MMLLVGSVTVKFVSSFTVPVAHEVAFGIDEAPLLLTPVRLARPTFKLYEVFNLFTASVLSEYALNLYCPDNRFRKVFFLLRIADALNILTVHVFELIYRLWHTTSTLWYHATSQCSGLQFRT
jgi:hypothetical protein